MSDLSSLSNCRPPSCREHKPSHCSLPGLWPSRTGPQFPSVLRCKAMYASGGTEAPVSSKAAEARAGLGLGVTDRGDASPGLVGFVFLRGETAELGTRAPFILPG